MDMNFIPIFGLIIVLISCIAIVAWIYRPNSSKIYSEYSQIPLRENNSVDV